MAVPTGPNGMMSVRQPVICLEGLNKERLTSVVNKVRDIHGTAYSWHSRDYVPDEFLGKLVREWTSFGDESVTRKPRPVLRELIHLLDLCEENPGVDLNEFFAAPMGSSTAAKEISDILEE